MSILECLIIAVGLSMDAFAVAICKGLSAAPYRIRFSWITGLWFGSFQALMPLLGYLLGSRFAGHIQSFDHWIAFILLVFIGGNMLREALAESEIHDAGAAADFGGHAFAPTKMLPLAVATSIDALAVGVTFAFLQVEILSAVSLIGVTTFFIAAAGVRIGTVFGERFSARAEAAGGIILIFMGLKILITHLLGIE